MKTKIVNIALGFVIGIAATLAIGAGSGEPEPVGRFQVNGDAGFFVIVDTTTGKAWFANTASPGKIGIDPDFFQKKTAN